MSFVDALPYVAFSVLLYSICGYTLLNKMLRVNLRKTYGFWVSLPIYLSAGIVLYTFILYVIGLIIFNEIIVILSVISILLLFLADLFLSVKRSNGTTIRIALSRLRKIDPRKLSSLIVRALPSITAAVVFSVSFLYLTQLIAIFMWPPPGDIINHGYFTSLIIYGQKIPDNFYYPLGLHIDTAFLALLESIYPGESVLLFGGILMIALVSLTFTLTYIITKSKILSLAAYLLMYLTQWPGLGGGNLEGWVFGYFFNGPYSSIFGFLIVLLSVTVITIEAKTRDQYVLTRFYPILMIVLLLGYPNFVFFSLTAFIFVVLQSGVINTIKTYFRTGKDILITSLLVILSIYFILYINSSVLAGQRLFSTTTAPAYAITQEYLESIFGFSIGLSLVFSLLMIAFSFTKGVRVSNLFPSNELRELRPVLLSYALFASLLFLSLNTSLPNFLQYLLPSRMRIIVMTISLVLNAYVLSRVLNILLDRIFRFVALEKWFPPTVIENLLSSSRRTRTGESNVIVRISSSTIVRRAGKSTLRNSIPMAKSIAVALVVFVILNPGGLLSYSLYSHATFDLGHTWAWFSNSGAFQNDFEGMEWLYDNVKSRELILNDWSFSGMFLLSLEVMNVSMYYSLLGMNRTDELQKVWLDPQNQTLVYSLLRKYNVSYIFSTSEEFYYSPTSGYVYKPYKPLQYIEFFSNYSYLEQIFRSGNTAVFKVR